MKDEVNGYRIYKNDYQIEFGMTYDTLYYKHVNKETPKYNQFYYGASVFASLRNEEVLFKGVILNDEDLDNVVKQHPDTFNVIDEAPSIEMDMTTIVREGIYAPYKINDKNEKEYLYLDPENPTRDIKDEFKVSSFANKDIPVNTYQLVYKPYYEDVFPHDEHGTYFVIDYPIRNPWSNYNTCVWLIDEAGKTITFDEVRYTESDNTYVGRALYSKVPVSKMIICPLGDKVYDSEYMNLYYEKYGKVINRLNKARDNGVNNLKYSVNTFTFDTNYDKEKFFVAQVAYTDGWKVKATDKDGNVTYLPTYNAQGGFLGFVAPEGQTSYEITYMTPGFVKWALVSAAAFLAMGALTAAPIIIRKRKEKRGEPLSSSN